MFLKELTPEEKEAFISLCVHAASANNIVEDTEFETIEEYCKEMGITFFNTHKVTEVENVIGLFSGSETRHKRIVIFGIIELLHSDGSYDNNEKNFIFDLAQKIGLSEGDVLLQSELVMRYLGIVNEINNAF